MRPVRKETTTKKNMLKNDYYFLVLNLAICDLAALIILVFYIVDLFWLEEKLEMSSVTICDCQLSSTLILV